MADSQALSRQAAEAGTAARGLRQTASWISEMARLATTLSEGVDSVLAGSSTGIDRDLPHHLTMFATHARTAQLQAQDSAAQATALSGRLSVMAQEAAARERAEARRRR